MKTEEWRGLPTIHLRLSTELHEICEREASKLGMKLTEFTKFAVISYLRSVNVPIHPQEERRDILELGKQLEEEAHEARRVSASTGEGGSTGEPASGPGD